MFPAVQSPQSPQTLIVTVNLCEPPGTVKTSRWMSSAGCGTACGTVPGPQEGRWHRVNENWPNLALSHAGYWARMFGAQFGGRRLFQTKNWSQNSKIGTDGKWANRKILYLAFIGIIGGPLCPHFPPTPHPVTCPPPHCHTLRAATVTHYVK